MRPLVPIVLVALVSIVPTVPTTAFATPAIPQEGPDVPTATTPIASFRILDGEQFAWTAGYRGRVITVPTEPWNRVVVVWTERPVGDPWDRTFSASIAGVEVLRGTTPRTEFTVTKDVTRYSALLPPGEPVRVEGYADSWVGAGQFVTFVLEFYNEPTAALVGEPATAVVGVSRMAGMCGGSVLRRTVTFPAEAPQLATAEFFLTGHGEEEFWFQNKVNPRTFRLYVDGREVATTYAMPYTYAFLGFAGADGQQNPTTNLIHIVMWWTAQRALDIAGIHGGVGEVPPYRALLHPDDASLLTGTRTVEIKLETTPQTRTNCVWFTGANFLLD